MKQTTHTHTGQRKDYNEDSVASVILEDKHLDSNREIGLFVLSDGAGGHESGDVASYIATTEVIRKLSEDLYSLFASNSQQVGIELPDSLSSHSDADTDDQQLPPLEPKVPEASTIQEKLVTAVNSAHQRMIEYVKEKDMRGGAHATIVVGLYVDDVLHYAWVGDSRLYVLNTEEDQFDLLTRDHAKVQQLEDQNKVDEVEAKIHPDGNQITRALGGKPSKSVDDTVNVETNSVEIYDSDIIFFTSDGIIDAYPHISHLWGRYQSTGPSDKKAEAEMIWDTVVTEEEIRDIILDNISGTKITEDKLSAAGRNLLTLGNQSGGKDNMSFIFVSGETTNPKPDPLPNRGPDEGIEIPASSDTKPKTKDPETEAENKDESESAETSLNNKETSNKSQPQDSVSEKENKSNQADAEDSTDTSSESESTDNNIDINTSKNQENQTETLALRPENSEAYKEISDGTIIGSSEVADITVSGEQVADKHVKFTVDESGNWRIHDLETTATWVLQQDLKDTKYQLGIETELFEEKISSGDWIGLGTVRNKYQIVKD